MAVELKRYRFTRADYHRMAQTGILKPNVRVELIDGDIVEMKWITVYTDPSADGYATTRVFRRGESLSPLDFPTLTVAVNDVLG